MHSRSYLWDEHKRDGSIDRDVPSDTEAHKSRQNEESIVAIGTGKTETKNRGA